MRSIAIGAVLAACAAPAAATDGAARKIVFVRGASGTGGFLEGGSDEQLSDIADALPFAGNHSWSDLRSELEAHGYVCVQLVETPGGPGGNGVPVDLAALDLAQVAVLVLASNNATYDAASVDAVEAFVENGGGLLVASDANWGQSWSDAPSSDQPFLSRFGLAINQDAGGYVLSRAEGDFVVGGVDMGLHPILAGPDGALGGGDDVLAFDGEGVSPLTVVASVPGVVAKVLAKAEGQIHVNDSTGSGSFRPATEADGALVVAEAGAGRVAGHYDRNTFFDANGAGTDLTRYDNRRYALNLFRWLAGERARPYGVGKPNSLGLVATLRGSAPPTAGTPLPVDVTGTVPGVLAIPFVGSGYDAAPLFGGFLLVRPPLTRLAAFFTGPLGNSQFPLPLEAGTAGSTVYVQLWYRDVADPLGYGIGLSRGLRVQVGP